MIVEIRKDNQADLLEQINNLINEGYILISIEAIKDSYSSELITYSTISGYGDNISYYIAKLYKRGR